MTCTREARCGSDQCGVCVLEKAVTQEHLTLDTVDAQFCSDYLKEEIKGLFRRLSVYENEVCRLRHAGGVLREFVPIFQKMEAEGRKINNTANLFMFFEKAKKFTGAEGG